MRTNRLKRERTASLSPPLRPSGSGGSPPPTPTAFVGLIQYRSGYSSNVVDATTRRLFVMQHNFLHMQALQEVLRRTSLAEMRDREVVEWLLGAERWLHDFHQPLQDPDSTAAERDGSAGGAGGGPAASTAASGGVSAPFFPASSVAPADGFTRAYSTALSELRLLVIGVLHTMPWWRVVETVAKDPSEKNFARTGADGGSGGQSSSGGGGSGAAAMAARRSRTAGGAVVAMPSASTRQISGANGTAAADRALAARQALTRWHVRLQIAFERVCMVLIEASQHTVRGVMEVLLKPCQLRPPVRDGARRSIPSDSFIRVLNAVATLYSTHYVMEVLESCITDFMPRQRWAERRHHVACTAVLLYVALEGHTPAFHPRLGNSQSLQRAVELLKSLRSRGSGGGGGDDDGSPWRLPRATRSSSLTVGTATSEDSGTDVGGGGGSSSATSGRHHHHHHTFSSSRGLSAMLPGSSGAGVLPAGYVSATLLEDARVGGRRLRQPALLRPDGATAHSSLMTTTTASDTEVSDGGAGGKGFVAAGADVLSESGGGGGGAAAQPAGFSAGLPHLSDVAVEHNNKLLAYRNSIVRLLLNRLLDVEQTLEPREGDEAADRASQMRGGREMSGTYASGGWGPSHGSFTGGRSPSGSAPPSASASPSSLFPASAAATTSALSHPSSLSGQSMLFPSAPAFAGAVNGTVTASSSALSSPAALSPAGIPVAPTGLLLLQHRPATVSLHVPFGAGVARPLEECFSRLSLPYLRILRDCTTLVYGRLADDLRRQQVAGSCGNADWWNEILYFYLTVAMRVERPVYLLYLAPSLAMLGTDDESVNVLHKLITLVTKGSMPMEQPGTMTATSGGSNAGGIRVTSLQPAQPVRLRMAPPTGGSRRVVTMEERLRAARHIFPLFRFLRSRLDDAGGEGLRRRLLKWTAQELRRLGGVGLTLSANNASCSSSGVAMRSRAQPSREMRLALVTFAQCAAMSELMGVDILPSPQTDGAAVSCTGKGGNGSGASFTATSASGDASDSIAAALQPLLARYTLQTEQPEEEMNDDARSDDGDGGRGSSAESSDSSTSSTPPRRSGRRRGRREKRKEAVGPAARRQLDLRQMEFEGLLQPLLMSYCPWQAWLR